ncbi:hypothetical protein GOBAR_DD13688 [Gossypium barbadense]|nr:hypothetical protein GOBAR_DD13688 [Gossypium barbadense]
MESVDLHETTNANHVDHGWQKVSYPKRQRKTKPNADPNLPRPNGTLTNGSASVFHSLEQQSDDRRRRIVEAQRAYAAAAIDADAKHKPKRSVTVVEAAAKIDPTDLSAYFAEWNGEQQEIQMQKFADYYGKAFQLVVAGQFPWLKLFRENIILEDLAAQQAGAKGSKKGAQQTSLKSKKHAMQVGIFVALGMVLQRKPDALISVLPKLRENSKYQGQDKLPIFAWTIVQASKGDLAVGLYSWAHLLLPVLSSKNCNPQSRDLILQLVEWILSVSKARSILVNNAVRKGERLVPPSSFEILMRATFPASSSRVKATERFEAIYPTVKEVALAGAHGSKAMRQVALQMFAFAIKAAGESSPELSKEAAGIVIWCLNQNAECYKQWDKVYLDNLEASVSVLRRLSDEWKEHSTKLTTLDPLRETIKNFRNKNEKEMGNESDAATQALFQDADKYCKLIAGRLSRGPGCLKALAFLVVAFGVGAAVVAPNMDDWDWNKLYVVISSQIPENSVENTGSCLKEAKPKDE